MKFRKVKIRFSDATMPVLKIPYRTPDKPTYQLMVGVRMRKLNVMDRPRRTKTNSH